MKFSRSAVFFCALSLAAVSCKQEPKNIWEVSVKNVAPVKIVDISKAYYDKNIPIENFKQQFPWFQGSVPDADFAARRADEKEIKIYKEAASKINFEKLNTDLSALFAHIKYYFPNFFSPKVFVYSSALEGIKDDPVFLRPDANMLFIDISAFMGDGNPNYNGLEKYFQASMNPANIVPKVAQTIAENMVPADTEHQKFLDLMVYNGKIMTLQDAFLPNEPDYLKMNYTQKQYDWAKANEANIWNYFVEKNLLFSDDRQLSGRFIEPGPFSKFYAEIDNESSPQVGIFAGWQICREFLKKNPDTKLQDFLKMNATEIFNKADYKPKNP